ncbi:hypothetical protein CEXT_474711 [Caerostris extrusa]|uniref:Uncharacterized protein n=1 Tax=Caerostris extrusa TaxID=172846 RepID=A0AAV4T9M7_CAEEX|nr:hypothetical protein CEXT_474711 [Caerostris extrusa]
MTSQRRKFIDPTGGWTVRPQRRKRLQLSLTSPSRYCNSCAYNIISHHHQMERVAIKNYAARDNSKPPLEAL